MLSLDIDYLKKVIKLHSATVSSKSLLPVLANICFRVVSGTLYIESTDMESKLSVQLTNFNYPDQHLFVPYAHLDKILKNFKTGFLRFEALLSDKKYQVSLTTGSKVFNLNSEEYVDELTIFSDSICKDTPKYLLDNSLLEGLSKVSFCASSNSTKSILNNISFKFTTDTLKLGATDGYRLGMYTSKLVESSLDPLSLIIGVDSVNILSKLLAYYKPSIVSVFVSDRIVGFKFDNIEFSTRIVEGQFPDYDRILPDIDSMFPITLDKESFISLSKLVLDFAFTDKIPSADIRFDRTSQHLFVSYSNPCFGDISDSIPFLSDFVGRLDYGFSLNVRFLLDILQRINSNDLLFFSKSPLAPLIIKDSLNADFSYMLMPIRP